MKTYIVEFQVTTLYQATVSAENEEDAKGNVLMGEAKKRKVIEEGDCIVNEARAI